MGSSVCGRRIRMATLLVLCCLRNVTYNVLKNNNSGVFG